MVKKQQNEERGACYFILFVLVYHIYDAERGRKNGRRSAFGYWVTFSPEQKKRSLLPKNTLHRRVCTELFSPLSPLSLTRYFTPINLMMICVSLIELQVSRPILVAAFVQLTCVICN